MVVVGVCGFPAPKDVSVWVIHSISNNGKNIIIISILIPSEKKLNLCIIPAT